MPQEKKKEDQKKKKIISPAEAVEEIADLLGIVTQLVYDLQEKQQLQLQPGDSHQELVVNRQKIRALNDQAIQKLENLILTADRTGNEEAKRHGEQLAGQMQKLLHHYVEALIQFRDQNPHLVPLETSTNLDASTMSLETTMTSKSTKVRNRNAQIRSILAAIEGDPNTKPLERLREIWDLTIPLENIGRDYEVIDYESSVTMYERIEPKRRIKYKDNGQKICSIM